MITQKSIDILHFYHDKYNRKDFIENKDYIKDDNDITTPASEAKHTNIKSLIKRDLYGKTDLSVVYLKIQKLLIKLQLVIVWIPIMHLR